MILHFFFFIFVIHSTKGTFFINYLYLGQRHKKFLPSLQFAYNRISEGVLFAPLLLQRLQSEDMVTTLTKIFLSFFSILPEDFFFSKFLITL